MRKYLVLFLLVCLGVLAYANDLPKNALTVDAIEIFQGILNSDFERKLTNQLTFTVGTEVVGRIAPRRNWESLSTTVGLRYYIEGAPLNGFYLAGKTYIGVIYPNQKFSTWIVPGLGINYVAPTGFSLNVGGDLILYVNKTLVTKPVFRVKLGYAW